MKSPRAGPSKGIQKTGARPEQRRSRPNLQFRAKNWILLSIGLVTIAAGYVLLSKGSITLAPILLVAGYCVIIPISILVK
ncbi:MAG: hypothetical protein ABIK62_06755 [candidate division WOR-3 bacterium]